MNAFATVSRPRPDEATIADLGHVLRALLGERVAAGARALVLTGTGKVFSAGADLDAARAGLAVSPLWEALSGAIAAAPALLLALLLTGCSPWGGNLFSARKSSKFPRPVAEAEADGSLHLKSNCPHPRPRA